MRKYTSVTTLDRGELVEEKYNDAINRTTKIVVKDMETFKLSSPNTNINDSFEKVLTTNLYDIYVAKKLWNSNSMEYCNNIFQDQSFENKCYFEWLGITSGIYYIPCVITKEGKIEPETRVQEEYETALAKNVIQLLPKGTDITLEENKLKDIPEEFKGSSFSICFTNLSKIYSINWGDGTIDKNVSGLVMHKYYSENGDKHNYTISIVGDILDNGLYTRTSDKMIIMYSGKIDSISFGEGVQVSKTAKEESNENTVDYYSSVFHTVKSINKINNIPSNFLGSKGYSLTTITFGNNCEYIGSNAFASAEGISGDFILPNTLKYIGNNAFSPLHITLPHDTFIIPDKVEEIGSYAFDSSGDLLYPPKTIIIGKNIQKIGYAAFDGWAIGEPNLILTSNTLLSEPVNIAEWFEGNEAKVFDYVQWLYVNKNLFLQYKDLLETANNKKVRAHLAIDTKDLLKGDPISICLKRLGVPDLTIDGDCAPLRTYILDLKQGQTWREAIEEGYSSYSNYIEEDVPIDLSIGEDGDVFCQENPVCYLDENGESTGRPVYADDLIVPFSSYQI